VEGEEEEDGEVEEATEVDLGFVELRGKGGKVRWVRRGGEEVRVDARSREKRRSGEGRGRGGRRC
jgi:hypothetical protein